ncbi:Zn-ribbon domain-containing OB-fold protein [Streptomyces rimosus]|uniref:Zn-ribbon domain-containing OB-fold protein n=1 Tax=Streptomyces rimosus TaxID=1927 RepID=UPI00067E0128|nr:Zn-ribbon domain-containing OB-fold protein [Streptomyces rimosus]
MPHEEWVTAVQPKTAPGHDLPETDAFSRVYWEAAAEGRLLLRRCRADGCGAAHHYPREFCPRCWSEDVVWEEASGRATLYTWSVVHRNDLPPFGDRVPYVAAVVDLAEGPRMMTEIVDCPEAHLRIGMALRVRFRRVEGAGTASGGSGANAHELAVPVFCPASSPAPSSAPPAGV